LGKESEERLGFNVAGIGLAVAGIFGAGSTSNTNGTTQWKWTKDGKLMNKV
jgi:hypothetical protein